MRFRVAGVGCVVALALALAALPACSSRVPSCRSTVSSPLPAPVGPPSHAGIHRIRHVIVVVQENRSFDSYFGTYPGADGIPMRNGTPAVSVPNSVTGTCVRPFHDTHL